VENDKIGKYWVKLRHLRHDYIEEKPDQDIRTMSRDEAQKYKHRGNWFQCAKSHLEAMVYEVKVDDKKLLENINSFIDSETSNVKGEMILDAEVAQANAVLDNAISYLESIVS